MLRERLKQFKIRLAIILISIAVTILSLSFGICYGLVKDKLIENSEQASLQVFQQMESTINLVADQVEKIVAQLMVDPHVINFFHTKNEDDLFIINNQRALIKIIDKVLLQNSFIDAIILIAEDGRKGGSSLKKTYFNLQSNKHPFVESEDYQKIIEQSPHFVWMGGYDEGYFYHVEDNKVKEYELSENLIVAKTIPLENEQGVMLVMLKEDIFSAYYEVNSSYDGEVSIVDMNGMKISSVNTLNIGDTIPYIADLNTQQQYGNIRYKGKEQESQVMYYKLPKYKWVLINEIPMQVYTNDTLMIRNMMIGIVMTTVVIMAVFFSIWVIRYTGPIQNLMDVMGEVSNGKIGQRINKHTDIEELEELNQQFNKMLDQVQFFMEVAEKREKEKSLLEMQALQMQINPHFLYNTINSIRWMAVMNGAENVGDAMVSLAELLNASFRKDTIIWELEQELGFVDSYIKLMTIRYGTGLIFEKEIEEGMNEYLIPKFIIQPILENSIKYRKADGEVLRIHMKIYERERLYVVITDNGNGIAKETLEEINYRLNYPIVDGKVEKSESIGLCNVNRRLRLYYEGEYTLEIKSSEGTGTEVMISIPKLQTSKI